MPKTINPIRKAKVKQALLQGKSARQALREAGYTEGTSSHSTDESVVKVSVREILTEQDKRGIIDKAWKVLNESLDNPKYKHTIANNIACKDMTAKADINNKGDFNKVIIQYAHKDAPERNVAINRGIPQDSIDKISTNKNNIDIEHNDSI